MKVCLVNPPVIGVFEPWYDTPDFGRTGLAYLAGYLRKHSLFEVKIIDAKLERLDFNQVIEALKAYNPDIIGITAFTNEIKPAAYLAAKVKGTLSNCLTVIGGVHVTAIPKETLLEFPAFDVGVIGEGEETLLELCTALKQNTPFENIKGIIYRKPTGQVVQTPPRARIADQDSIPFPAWDLMPAAKTYFVQSERGCPLNCIFCMNPNGRVARKRSIGNVMEELNYIIETFKPERISFGDELFSVDMPRTRILLDAMIEHKIGERVKWDVQTHVQYVDYDMFVQFKKAGVERVELGIETGDEEALRRMGKGTNLEKINAAIKAGKKAGVNIGTFFLFGQPNETIQSLQRTVNLAVKLNPQLPMFGLMTPYPGTEVAKLAAKGEGGYTILTTNWDEYNKQIGGAMAFANLSRRQIEFFQVKAYLLVYLLNYRFIDLIVFLWGYRKAAWYVMKKILFGKESLSSLQNLKPADYESVVFNPEYSPQKDILIEARETWNNYQLNESKRLKLLSKISDPV
jgi:anaerobic magnesium-protoporphyrin IX monomethyl ester cyclase